ncbi:MAG TPA: IS110 family transposase [Acidimicrobiales bacterium]
MSEYAGRQFVGIDLHRRRSVVVRTTESGEVLEATRILNDVDRLNSVMERAGEDPEVVLEATYGWYWAVDALEAAGARVHLAHPLGVKAFEYRRVKNDVRDATDLADLLRMGRLPEAWISDPRTRELRELVRHRAKLVGLRSHCKAEVHAVLAKCGIQVLMSDLFSVAGNDLLDRVPLPGPYAARVRSLRRLIDDLEDEIDLFGRLTRGRLVADPGYTALQQLPGVGPVLAAVFLAEVGDVSRFRTAAQLACWAGFTPKHHESDTHVHRGRITKQGSRLVRWAAVESVKALGATSVVGAYKKRVADRRGKNIGTVAAARKQVEFVFYALRDHHVRALHPPRPPAGAAA